MIAQTDQTAGKVLLEVQRPRYRLRLCLEKDGLECRADLDLLPPSSKPPLEDTTEPPVAGEPDEEDKLDTRFLRSDTPSVDEMLRLLKMFGIDETVDRAEVEGLCVNAADGVGAKNVLLAQGVAPVGGEDGWFEMFFKHGDARPEYYEDEKGRVDLRTLHTCTEIKPEQKLGVVHGPKAGKNGMTVRGEVLPAAAGKAFDLIAGTGVHLKYNRRIAFATKAGRALLDRKTLSVVDELVITGNLDLGVGNINFHGFVEVRGDVLDDFSIKATRGMRISGNVGACRLEAEGPIEIGSMSGGGTGQIICHGLLKAKYLNQVQVSCYGHVCVTNEIRHSQIKATGQILVERGVIIGGKCTALEGIEARELGAASGVRTHLVAGRYFPDVDRFDYLHRRRVEIDQQLKLITDALGPLEQGRSLRGLLENASEQRLIILNQQWEKLEEEKARVDAEIRVSSHQIISSRNPKINVHKVIKEGVVVCLGQASERFSSDLAGPVSLIENSREGTIRHLGLSPLSQSALVLEKELLQLESL
jgi:uncharacterized protein (DUF342 family)